MAKIKILILSVSAGAGHMRAAQALCAAAQRPGTDARAVHVDAMRFASWLLRALYVRAYLYIVKSLPSAWRSLYRATHEADPGGWANRIRCRTEAWLCRRLLREVRLQQPDCIVCTHFLPAAVLSRQIAKGALAIPVWVQVTDFDVHRAWVQPCMAGYFAANEEAAFHLHKLGVAPEKIHATGIPVMPGFAAPVARAARLLALGLDPAKQTLLLMGGGAGIGSLPEAAARLLQIPIDFQLIVLAGKNLAALARLDALAKHHPGKLLAQGHTDQVEHWMACADLVITKPGGLTVSECLSMGVPMVLTSPIPGQEEQNATYLLEQGAAMKAEDSSTLEYRVRYLLTHPDRLAGMRDRAKLLGRPDAAARALALLLQPIHDAT